MKKIYYFGAAWCGQCRVLKPVFQKEAQVLGLTDLITYFDADCDEEVCHLFNIRNLPTIILLKDDVEVDRNFGVEAWKSLEAWAKL